MTGHWFSDSLRFMDRSSWGPATIALAAIAVIVVLIGGIVVIVHPATLSFVQYLDALKMFALAVGGLAIGRGLHLGLASQSESNADEDGLAHIPVHRGRIRTDEGDPGHP